MKQVVLSIMIIVTVGSLGVIGTYAGFVDTEVSEGNSFQTGSFDLILGDTYPYPGEYPWRYELDEDFGEDPLGDSVSGTWHYNPGYTGGMQPGDWLESRVKLMNFGTLGGTALDIQCIPLNFDTSLDDTDVPKDAVMVIEFLTYYNGPPIEIVKTDSGVQWWDTSYINDMDGDLRITLHDWELHGISGLSPPPLAGAALDMKVVFDPPPYASGPTSIYYLADLYSGFKTNMTLIFTLR